MGLRRRKVRGPPIAPPWCGCRQSTKPGSISFSLKRCTAHLFRIKSLRSPGWPWHTGWLAKATGTLFMNASPNFRKTDREFPMHKRYRYNTSPLPLFFRRHQHRGKASIAVQTTHISIVLLRHEAARCNSWVQPVTLLLYCGALGPTRSMGWWGDI